MMKVPGRFGVSFAFALALELLPVAPAGAQQPVAGGETLESIHAEFRKGVAELERARLEKLARLAAGQDPGRASETYEEYFRLVIANGLYREAEPTAELVAKAPGLSKEVGALAVLVNIIAEADRGAYRESIASIDSAIRAQAGEGEGIRPAVALPLETRLALIDAYYRRLLQAGQYEVAREALRLVGEHTQAPAIKGIVAARLKQLDLIGKPAPAIEGEDIDGRPVRLADFRGEVVLVEFWATWCLPPAPEVARFKEIVASHRPKGLRVVGVNLDAAQDGGRAEAVSPHVRRVLLDHNIPWPTLINGPGPRDYAAAFGVTEIPANVLIGRDGKVLRLDLTLSNLEAALAEALGK